MPYHINIKANKGVILAAGGFEKDQSLRDQYLPKPSKAEWSAANTFNTGDALKAALRLGADTHQMDTGWWSTVMKVPAQDKGWLSMVDKSIDDYSAKDFRELFEAFRAYTNQNLRMIPLTFVLGFYVRYRVMGL